MWVSTARVVLWLSAALACCAHQLRDAETAGRGASLSAAMDVRAIVAGLAAAAWSCEGDGGSGAGGGGCLNNGVCRGGRCFCPPGFAGDACGAATCAAGCSGHGYCHGGDCVCRPGWVGADCAQPGCFQNCSSHGICVGGGRWTTGAASWNNNNSATCFCEPDFKGEYCQHRVCPLGANGQECSGTGRCAQGVCFFDSTGGGGGGSGGARGGGNRNSSRGGSGGSEGGAGGGSRVHEAGTTPAISTTATAAISTSATNSLQPRASCTISDECPLKQLCVDGACADHQCRGGCGRAQFHGVCVDNACACAPDRTGDDCGSASTVAPPPSADQRAQWCMQQYCPVACHNRRHDRAGDDARGCAAVCEARCPLRDLQDFLTMSDAERRAALNGTHAAFSASAAQVLGSMGIVSAAQPLQVLRTQQASTKGHEALEKLQRYAHLAQNSD